jgi:hypothetical protein
MDVASSSGSIRSDSDGTRRHSWTEQAVPWSAGVCKQFEHGACLRTLWTALRGVVCVAGGLLPGVAGLCVGQGRGGVPRAAGGPRQGRLLGVARRGAAQPHRLPGHSGRGAGGSELGAESTCLFVCLTWVCPFETLVISKPFNQVPIQVAFRAFRGLRSGAYGGGGRRGAELHSGQALNQDTSQSVCHFRVARVLQELRMLGVERELWAASALRAQSLGVASLTGIEGV